MPHTIQYLGANGDRGPSPSIWGNFKALDIIEDPSKGVHLFEEFLNFGGVVATNVGTYGPGWKSFENNSCSIKQIPSEVAGDVHGAIRFLTDATDNNEANMEAGYANGGAFVYTDALPRRLFYEVRVRFTQIVTQNIFLGLAEKGLAVTDGFFSDSDTVQDKSWLGFDILAAASATLRAVHQKNGGSGEVNVGTAQTIVAATWYKFGFIVDYNAFATKRMRWFANGLEVQNITDTSVAKFPSGVILTPAFCLKNSAGAISSFDVDWLRVGQLF